MAVTKSLKSSMAGGVAAALALGAIVLPATTADARPLGEEIRIGIMDHDTGLIRDRRETDSPDINAEVLFASPEFLDWAYSPRPLIGATINTDDGTSLGYAGLGWNFDLGSNFFFDASFGAAIHNGETDKVTNSSRNYGCRVQFHETISIGYDLTANHSLMATFEHMSNAELCDKNDGMTDIGIRYGYRF
ncbi:lipid A 3-O-deacylase [Parvibaculum indicum]|uniref:acyloxyacyl hydrolase n=1 Tax=Parvibaculum indicum TaxID=562969 RepID=UPI00141EFB0E|nr:lipid A 3-O-deacylase [Parvibaculum indicum]